MSRGNVINKVLPELTRRPGEIIYVGEIVEVTGLDRRQVAMAVYNARQNNASLAADIEVVIAANAWRYRPRGWANGEVKTTSDAPAVTSDVAPTRNDAATNDAPVTPVTRRDRRPLDPLRRLYEEVHVTRDGVTIVEDENGKLYRVEEL